MGDIIPIPRHAIKNDIYCRALKCSYEENVHTSLDLKQALVIITLMDINLEYKLIRVIYRNSHEGVVDDITLDELIQSHKVMLFYRPSQDKWIDVEADPVRLRESRYDGPERRASVAEETEHGEEKPRSLMSRMLRRKRKPAASGRMLTSDEWFEKGFVALHTEDEEEKALRAFAACIRLDPANQRAYFNRGLSYEKVGNLHQAIDDYCKAIDLDPEDAKVHYVCGLARMRLGMDKEGMEDLEKAVSLGYWPAVSFLKTKGSCV